MVTIETEIREKNKRDEMSSSYIPFQTYIKCHNILG